MLIENFNYISKGYAILSRQQIFSTIRELKLQTSKKIGLNGFCLIENEMNLLIREISHVNLLTFINFYN